MTVLNLIIAVVETARRFLVAGMALTEREPRAHQTLAGLIAAADDALDELNTIPSNERKH